MGATVSVPEILTSENRGAQFQAVVAGATGASGRWIVKALLEDPQCLRVVALTRRPLTELEKVFGTAKLEKLVISSFEKFPTVADFLPAVETVAAVAMGSAPYTEEADYNAPVSFGHRARDFGVSRCVLVSAAGAQVGSVFGYVDTLGRREATFKAIGFPDGLFVFRPKLLLRQELRRTKEKIFETITPDSQSIDTRDMAVLIVKALKADNPQHLSASIDHAQMKASLAQAL